MWLLPVVLFCCLEHLMAQNLTQEETNCESDEDWRIAGGRTVKLSKSPWMVVLQANGRHICGGSIISNTKILTAAHCLPDVPTNMLSVRIGSSMSQKGGRVLQVSKKVLHQSYDKPKFSHDIGILTVPKFKFIKGTIGRVNLPTSRRTFKTTQMFTMTGFGITKPNGKPSPNLRSVNIPFVSLDVCKKSYMSPLSKDMLCAGYEHGRKNACKGDSGGPLTSGRTQLGIASFGGLCGRPMKYGVFANVSYFISWIKKNMK